MTWYEIIYDKNHDGEHNSWTGHANQELTQEEIDRESRRFNREGSRILAVESLLKKKLRSFEVENGELEDILFLEYESKERSN